MADYLQRDDGSMMPIGHHLKDKPEQDKFTWQGDEIAWDRAETDPCERGTPGCSVRHTRDSECQTW